MKKVLCVCFVLASVIVLGQVPFIENKDEHGQPVLRTFIINPDSLISEGHELYRQGKREEALERFAAAAKAVPTSVDARYYAAVLYLQLGRLFEAEVEYDKIRELVRFFKGVGRGLFKDRVARAVKAQTLLEKKLQEKSQECDYTAESAKLAEWFQRVSLCQGITIRESVASDSMK
jgi:tetratricopeptide (TPR) repeat protein